jgi:hypothetical protein
MTAYDNGRPLTLSLSPWERERPTPSVLQAPWDSSASLPLGPGMTEGWRLVRHGVTATSLCHSEGAEHPKNPIAPEGVNPADRARRVG